MKSSAPRRWSGIGIAALAVLALVLAVMAYVHANPPVRGVGETPGYTAQSVGPQSEPEVQEAEEVAPAPVAPATVAPASRLLTALGGETIMRATTGACPEAVAGLALSSNGGETWVPQDVGSSVGLSAPTRLADIGNGSVALLGANPNNCAEQVAAVGVAARGAWSAYGVQNLWRVAPEDPTRLLGPGGVTRTPGCEVARFSVAAGGRLAVVCADTSLAVSADGGLNWEHADPHPGADSVVATDAAVVVAAVEVPGCGGVQITSLDAGLAPTAAVCVPAEGVGQGATALSAAPDGVLWMSMGDAIVRSRDGGQTWS